jgi:nickel-dependent lactate racemase
MLSIPYDGGTIASELLSAESVRWIAPKPFAPRKINNFAEALGNPVNSKRLEKEKFKNPILVFADDTRLPSPFVPELIKKLKAKIENVKLMIACGTHVIPKEMHAKSVLGSELFSFLKGNLIYSSTHNPASIYESIGRTSRGTEVQLNRELLECDFVLSTLCVRPHYFAGWEGGAKALLPGCSGFATISQNHSYVIGNNNARELVIKGNPVREDINEVPNLLEKKRGIRHRILDFVPSLQDEPIEAKYGDPVEAHRELARFGERICVVRTRPSSLVVTVSEGSLGRNFYQALKAATHSSNILRLDGGQKPTLILIGRMEEGIGSDTFRKEFKTYIGMDPEIVMDSLKKRVEEGTFNETLQKVNRMMMYLPKANFMVVSPDAPAELETMLKSKDIFFSRGLDEALETLSARSLKEAAIVPQGNATVPLPLV